MKKYRNFLLGFGILLIVPLFFLISAQFIFFDMNKQARDAAFSWAQQEMTFGEYDSAELKKAIKQTVNIHTMCTTLEEEGSLALDEICSTAKTLRYFNSFALAVMLLALFSALITCALARFAEKNRLLLLLSFKSVFFVLAICSIVLLLGQSILLCSAIFYLMLYFTGYVAPKLLIIIAAIGLFTSISILKTLVRRIKAQNVVVGCAVSKKEQPKLWEFVRDTAKKFNATAPKNIVLGLGCYFFVTEADVLCLSGKLTGRTLFLSISCLKNFSQHELEAIIIHELSHFEGKDTVFGLRLHPTWQKTHSVVANISSTDSALLIPFQLVFDGFVTLFAEAYGKFSKQSEEAADKNAARIVSNKDIASALVKLNLFSLYWRQVERDSVELVKDGKCLTNKSLAFCELLTTTKLNRADMTKALQLEEKSLPADSHPSLGERLEYLGVDATKVLPNVYKTENDSSVAVLIESIDKISEELSAASNHLLFKGIKI